MAQTILQPPEKTLGLGFQVLMVEDDANIARLVEANLLKARLGCRIVKTGCETLNITCRDEADLILLDLDLPDMSGLEVCRKIRQSSNVPIIMATARSEVQDQMNGLRVGADDYVTKPFEPQVLVARVIAQLRRAHRYSQDSATSTSNGSSTAAKTKSLFPTRNAPAGSTPVRVMSRTRTRPSTSVNTYSTVPPRWHKCGSCNYMGPRGKFESPNDLFGVVNACPHCGQPARL